MSDSYIKKPIGFKIKKVVRYLALYGLVRTWIKVKAQYHMNRQVPEAQGQTNWTNPACKDPSSTERDTALIGCGAFAYSAIGFYLRKHNRQFLRVALDADLTRAISLTKDFVGAMATTEMQDILTDDHIRIVYIASNHASHAEYAIECIKAGKDVHIEKPHVVSQDQLDRLLETARAYPSTSLYLGFNRPKSDHFQFLNEYLQAESGPIMINWFIAGHEIPDDHWYFDEMEGGRVLGNLCHWTDLTLELVGSQNAFPARVVPGSLGDSQSDFCVVINFRDESVAALTFSAKGHTFEGVREVLQAHRGNVLLRMSDFKETVVEIVEKRHRLSTFRRDHGHSRNIMNSYRKSDKKPVPIQYVSDSARLFLAVKEALDTGNVIEIKPSSQSDQATGAHPNQSESP